MKPLLCALFSVILAACVRGDKAGPYPNGFITGSHMHYWNPKVGRFLFGSNEPHPEPYVWPQPSKATLVSPSGQIIKPNVP